MSPLSLDVLYFSKVSQQRCVLSCWSLTTFLALNALQHSLGAVKLICLCFGAIIVGYPIIFMVHKVHHCVTQKHHFVSANWKPFMNKTTNQHITTWSQYSEGFFLLSLVCFRVIASSLFCIFKTYGVAHWISCYHLSLWHTSALQYKSATACYTPCIVITVAGKWLLHT